MSFDAGSTFALGGLVDPYCALWLHGSFEKSPTISLELHGCVLFLSALLNIYKQCIALLPIHAVMLLHSHFLAILKVQRYCCRSLHDHGAKEARRIGNVHLHSPTCHRCLTNKSICLQPGTWSKDRGAYLAIAINDPHAGLVAELTPRMRGRAPQPELRLHSFTSSVAAAASCLGTSSILGRFTTLCSVPLLVHVKKPQV
jgi:hypothetical protein